MKNFVVYTILFVLFGIILGAGAVSVNFSDVNFVPVGTIVIWTGHANDFDQWGNMLNNTDWHLCNGHNGTTDLQGKFVVMINEEENTIIGETGGNHSFTLLEPHMPSHDHSYYDNTPAFDGFDVRVGQITLATSLDDSYTGKTGETGDDKPFDNRPEYYTVAYIQCIN